MAKIISSISVPKKLLLDEDDSSSKNS